MNLLMLAGLLAQAVAAPSTAAPTPLVLPAGTAVPLVTLGEVSSKVHKQGDRFDLEVSADVMVGNQVAIPRGARAVGEVARHAAKGAFGKPGKLEVRLLHVIVGERRIRLDGVEKHRGPGSVAPVVAATVISAAVGSLIQGKHALIPAGTPVTGYVHRNVALQRAN